MKIGSILVAASMAVVLAACDKPESAAPAAAPATAPAPVAAAPAAATPQVTTPAAAPVAAAPAANAVGKSVYGKTCALCHAAGVAGAPKPGDKEAWAPRIAQGNDVLYKHAIEGFTGEKGMMPARGTGASLSDDEVKAAVDYMVSLSQ